MANKLRVWRIALGLTMAELASRAGVTQGTICRLEHGGVQRLNGGTTCKIWLALRDAGQVAGVEIPGREQFVEALLAGESNEKANA